MNGSTLSVLAAALAFAAAHSASAADYDYTMLYCNTQGAKCITYTVYGRTPGDGGGADGDANWYIDRIFIEIDADECRVPVNIYGATELIEGRQPLDVPAEHTPFTKTWRVPASCPYHLHMRYSPPFPYSDTIYNDNIDAVTAEQDYCFNYNFETDVKSHTGCPTP